VRTALEQAAEPGAEIAAGDMVCATTPGVISELLVATGDEVVAGQRIATLEAMKLFHALAAPRAGRVAHVAAQVGDKVAQHAVILTLDSESRHLHAHQVVEAGCHRIRAAPLNGTSGGQAACGEARPRVLTSVRPRPRS
jgi:pyruvate/2-oxoglutarate dehydrogenase complex dihydrolipoamide acyltransferase (E2) component